jgi:hypothetical protein
VVVEKGYINYVTIAQHRNSWQDIGGVLVSKAGLVAYSLEVAKQLDLRFVSPPLPVDLNVTNSSREGELTPKDLGKLTDKA